MTASLQKLTAGSGYTYLTRQVAAMDSTEKGRTTLTSYYSEKGETPGRWVGSGLAALDMRPGSPVDEVQMRALFGSGFHPNGEARLAALSADATPEQVRQAQRLGAPFQVRRDATRFQQLVAECCGAWVAENGLKPGGEVPVDVLAGIRSGLASEAFAARVGRPPSGLELSTEVARLSRNPNTACAGFDVTFSPVKSVSTLWAIAPRDIAAQIEEAHNQAVEDALGYIEEHVLYSRRGAGGVRQVEVTGLVGTAFTHRDSRAGDPDLHTHVAIANKARTLDGHWLAIDARPLYAGLVSISEVYNTSLEARLVERLGVRFAVESNRDPSKRGIREIVGVPALLREAWSKRRTAIVVREADLAAKFQADHHRPPTPVEASKLAQQATLETRDAKHEPRTIDEQRAAWRSEAERLLGPRAVGHILDATRSTRDHKRPAVTSDWIGQAAGDIVESMGLHRASWTRWHLHAEASRRARERAMNADHAKQLTEELLAAATALCVPVDTWTDPIQEPSDLRRTTGESTYQTVGTRRFTSAAVLRAEQQIMDAAALTDGPRAAEADVTVALLRSTSQGIDLNAGQVDLVRELATSGKWVQLALAAAGAGKTTALAVLANAWRETERQVVGLAPSAVAARQLEDQIGHGTTLAKLAWDITNRPRDAANLVQPGTLLIIDEAGMADTPTLARIIGYATDRGASVRLIGDDQQLASIGAGGILRDLATTHGAVTLNQILRFTDPAEAAASLALRDGRPEALGYYLDQNRLHPGTAETVLTDALDAWIRDKDQGLDSLMLAGTRDQAATLNHRARQHRLHGNPTAADQRRVDLADGNQASRGDVIITRLNDRRLRVSDTDWVKNGDRWTITRVSPTGTVHATHRRSGLPIRLPADYVRDHVELGYAVTVHTSQGITVDTTHTILTGTETRQQAYVALTRGRAANHAYIQIVGDTTEATPIDPTTLRPQTVLDVCESVLARDSAQRSVTTETREAADPYSRLGIAVARYTDALTVALEDLHPDQTRELDERADQTVNRLTDSPAWTTLRAHLLHAAAHYDQHTTPLDLLHRITNTRELATANDPAAVLTWRLPHPTTTGPLPWLPDIPTDIAGHDQWGPYLAARAQQVQDTAAEVRHTAASPEPPGWALPGQPLTPELVADIEVWRASWQVDRDDRRPTGPARLGTLPARHQQQLQDRIHPVDPVHPWLQRLHDIRHDIPQDDSAPALAHRLADLHRQGLPAARLLTQAADDGPLPAEQPADALWWRITRHLLIDNPSGRNQNTTTETLHPTPVLLPGDLAALLAQASGRNKTHDKTRTRPTPQAPPPR
ncbi:MobF family relaxase [Tessaracoccus lubricantis]|uniref:MobF family relaxase n=1 Tax=Tessaracoccus lubricantis TaxID=545543 RepID=A0ABP9FN95_9ACTN